MKPKHPYDNVFSIFDKESKRMNPISNEEYEKLKDVQAIYWTGGSNRAKEIYQNNIQGKS